MKASEQQRTKIWKVAEGKWRVAFWESGDAPTKYGAWRTEGRFFESRTVARMFRDAIVNRNQYLNQLQEAA